MYPPLYLIRVEEVHSVKVNLGKKHDAKVGRFKRAGPHTQKKTNCVTQSLRCARKNKPLPGCKRGAMHWGETCCCEVYKKKKREVTTCGLPEKHFETCLVLETCLSFLLFSGLRHRQHLCRDVACEGSLAKFLLETSYTTLTPAVEKKSQIGNELSFHPLSLSISLSFPHFN